MCKTAFDLNGPVSPELSRQTTKFVVKFGFLLGTVK